MPSSQVQIQGREALIVQPPTQPLPLTQVYTQGQDGPITRQPPSSVLLTREELEQWEGVLKWEQIQRQRREAAGLPPRPSRDSPPVVSRAR